MIREDVINQVLRDPSALASIVPRGIRHRSVRIDVVSVLPQSPQDGDEVYLEVDATSHAVAHMLYLRAIPGWVQTGAPPILTTLPATGPHEGFQVVYDTGTAGVRWSLVYDTSDGTTYPWLYVGGAALRATNTGTSMTTTSTAAYVDLSTVGPTLTAPLAGEYEVEAWAQAQNDTAAALGTMALKIGAAATSDTNAVRGQAPAANYDISISVYSQVIAAAAADVLKMQFKVNAGTLTVNNAGLLNPWMTVRPVRVAGA